MLLGTSITDRYIDNAVSADNYVLFSITKATLNEKTKVIGFGVFGNIFLSKKLDDLLKD